MISAYTPKAVAEVCKPHLLDSVGDALQGVQLLLSHRLEKGLRGNTGGSGGMESVNMRSTARRNNVRVLDSQVYPPPRGMARTL